MVQNYLLLNLCVFLAASAPIEVKQGRTFGALFGLRKDASTQLLTSCTTAADLPSLASSTDSGIFSFSDDYQERSDATFLTATIFLVSDARISVKHNMTELLVMKNITTDGEFVTTLGVDGANICDSPLLLDVLAEDSNTNIQVWWTITENIIVSFFRQSIQLPPGRTHSVLVNTTSFYASNLIIVEATINNTQGAADIAKLYANRNSLATPYSYLEDCPFSNITVKWKNSPFTQYSLTIPPHIYMPSSDGNPLFFSIWFENTSNFTLSYDMRVTQSSEHPLQLGSPPIVYPTPYSFTSFFNFSKSNIQEAMMQVYKNGDSTEIVSLLFDLSIYFDQFTSKRTSIYLGLDMYPTFLNFLARTTQANPISNPGKPEIFQRLVHTLNMSTIAEESTFHLRIDGVAYSENGYILEPMVVNTKFITHIPYKLDINDTREEWTLFTMDPKLMTDKHIEDDVVINQDLAVQKKYYNIYIDINKESMDKISCYYASKNFPTEITNEYKFEKENGYYHLCLPLDPREPASFTIWNRPRNRAMPEPISITFSMRQVDACLVELIPAVNKPMNRSTFVVLIVLGSLLGVALILSLLCTCMRPTKTEFLTPSEEEAERIRNMNRIHTHVQVSEAGGFHKVPFLVQKNTPMWEPLDGEESDGPYSRHHDDDEQDPSDVEYY